MQQNEVHVRSREPGVNLGAALQVLEQLHRVFDHVIALQGDGGAQQSISGPDLPSRPPAAGATRGHRSDPDQDGRVVDEVDPFRLDGRSHYPALAGDAVDVHPIHLQSVLYQVEALHGQPNDEQRNHVPSGIRRVPPSSGRQAVECPARSARHQEQHEQRQQSRGDDVRNRPPSSPELERRPVPHQRVHECSDPARLTRERVVVRGRAGPVVHRKSPTSLRSDTGLGHLVHLVARELTHRHVAAIEPRPSSVFDEVAPGDAVAHLGDGDRAHRGPPDDVAGELDLGDVGDDALLTSLDQRVLDHRPRMVVGVADLDALRVLADHVGDPGAADPRRCIHDLYPVQPRPGDRDVF